MKLTKIPIRYLPSKLSKKDKKTNKNVKQI
jgi:hypothetical protein